MAFSTGISNITYESAHFWADFTGGDSGYAGYRYVRLALSDAYRTHEYIIRSSNMGGGDSYFDYDLDGLYSDMNYQYEAELGYGSASNPTWLGIMDYGDFRTDPEPVHVEPWSWTSSNGQATSAETRTAYDVLYGNVPANEFSHYVWNDLVDKVAEMRDGMGYTWDRAGGTYPSASGCKLYAGDTLSASAYNGVRYNIGSVMGTGITDRSPGDRIYGYLIYDLTTTLNDIIDRYLS